MSRVSSKTLKRAWFLSIFLAVILGSLTLVRMYIPYIAQMLDSESVSNYTSLLTISQNEDLYLFTLPIPLLNIDLRPDIIDMTALTVISLILLPAYYYRKDYKYKNAVDNKLPTLLREVSDSQKVGLPLPKAVLEAAKHQYGALTGELRKMSSKMSWGIGFQEALRSMADNIDTPLFNRTAVLILEAERAGGSVEDVFDAAYSHVSELLALKRERLGSMKPYTWIIYASFIVFSIVVILLLQIFFANLALNNSQFAGSEGITESGFLPVSLAFMQITFYHMLLIEGAFSGVVAGKMGQGDGRVGTFHSIIMVLFAWFFFKIATIWFGAA